MIRNPTIAILVHRRHNGRLKRVETSEFGLVVVLGKKGRGKEITLACAHLPNSWQYTDEDFCIAVDALSNLIHNCDTVNLLLGMDANVQTSHEHGLDGITFNTILTGGVATERFQNLV